jgi:hypothetical protein
MSYLLITAILLALLFLWSQLPDPAGRRAMMVTSLPDRDSDGVPTAKADERGMKPHPDQLGEPDEHGRIRIGVNDWLGPDPTVPGYVPCRIDLDHVAHPPRVVTYTLNGSAAAAAMHTSVTK